MAGDHTVVGRRLLDTPTDYLLAVVVGVAGSAMFGTWAVGQAAGLLFQFTWPDVDPTAGLSIAADLPAHWGDPRQAWPEPVRSDLPGPVGMYSTAVLLLALLVVGAMFAVRLFGGQRQVRGMASRHQLQRSLSAKAVLARAGQLRPGLEPGAATLTDVAVPLGAAVHIGRMPLYASIENSILLIAAPRQGKTSQIIIPWLRSWPGPALVTSVRPDVVLNTMTLRGDAAVMDLTGAAWPTPLRWSPTTDCEHFDKARQRADVMVQVGKDETRTDSTNAGFFGLTATNLLAGWLHAAALTGLTMADILRWALDERLDEPIRLLRKHPDAATGVAAMLDNVYRSPTETRSNMWATVMTAVAPLLSTAARRVFCPPPAESFDITAFLRGGGTAYLLVAENTAADLAPLVSAFVDEVTAAAKILADQTPAGRLDPPLGLFLDEVANVVPLPNLPALMSYAAGTGIFVTAVLQDLAQARQRWGRDGADMLWGASTVKIALGGLGGDELGEFAKLAGSYRETLHTTQHSSQGTSISTSLVDRNTLSAHEIRILSDDGRQALVIHANTPAVKTRMRRHYEGRDAAVYAKAVTDARALLAAPSTGIKA